MKKAASFLILFIVPIICFSQKDIFDTLAIKQNWPEFAIGSVIEKNLESKYIQETYDIYIYLPPSYYHTDKTYPLLVLTDAFHAFGIAENCSNLMLSSGEIPEIIIVGIGFKEYNTIEFVRKRMRDLAYAGTERYKQYSQVESFYRFVSDELMPMIEEEYRIDESNKTFNGFSAGANFGIYLLIKHPDLFKNYILGSPGFWWDNRSLLQMSQNSLPTWSPKNETRIYTFVGEFDMSNDWKNFKSILQKNGSDKLEVKYQLYKGASHTNVFPQAFPNALLYIYNNPKD
ncbi:MAG: alpha/beta hydrolase [Bacteroidota bacterium]